MSLDVIEKGEGRDEEIKVRALVVLESKVIYQRRCHERRDGRDRGWWFGGSHEKKDGRGDEFGRACLPP